MNISSKLDQSLGNSVERDNVIAQNLMNSVFDDLIDSRLSFLRTKSQRRIARVVVLIALTWLPIFFLSVCFNHAFSGVVNVPLLKDPSVYGRFLFVLPLLELAEVLVALSLITQARYFVESEVVPDRELGRYKQLIQEFMQFRTSASFELVMGGLALAISLIARFSPRLHLQSTWQHVGGSVTLAGWWYTIVSLPILLFFMLRWLAVYALWARFLFRVSRLDLELTPTHPDHAGGLGFLGWGLASYSTVWMAISAVFSAGFAYEIMHRHDSLDNLKFHIIVFLVLAVFLNYAPLLVFSVRLARCRLRGLLDYSSLVLQHDRAFDEKWIIKNPPVTTEPLLGSSDIQSLADIATAYEHVYDMRLMPFDAKAFFVIALSLLLPLLPLVATIIPLDEIFKKLLELIV